ncbi:MAG: DUF3848 domain-containing protein [Bacteroidales bacterium]|nr:DUF3848 domain-containing protein [Bacteroidales bacterium]
MDENEKLVYDLYEKLQKEYNNFINEMKLLSPEQLIEKSYEITCKSQYPDMFNSTSNYSNEELEALLKQENTLQYLYDDWYYADGGINKTLEQSMEIGLGELVEKVKKENPNHELLQNMEEALKQLNNYELAYYVEKHFNIEDMDEYNLGKLLDKKVNARDLCEYFKDMKDNKQVKYLVEISTFDSEVYDKISTDIIPKLDKIAKEQDKTNHKEKKNKDYER